MLDYRRKYMKDHTIQQGFTLIELLVSLGIFILFIGPVAWFVSKTFLYNKIILEQLQTQNESRKALQHFVADVRTASASSIGSYLIEQATPFSITFYSNVDTDAIRERVRYFLEATNLRRGILKPSGQPLHYTPAEEIVTTMIESVANTSTPIFTYFDGLHTPLPEPVTRTDIRIIRMHLQIEEDPSLSPTPLSSETQVKIRNLTDQ